MKPFCEIDFYYNLLKDLDYLNVESLVYMIAYI